MTVASEIVSDKSSSKSGRMLLASSAPQVSGSGSSESLLDFDCWCSGS